MIVTSRSVGAVHAGEGHTFMCRRDYRPDGTRRGCLFVHGAGADSTQILSAYRTIPAAIAAYGVPVLACDLGGDTWGNDTVSGAGGRLAEAKAFMEVSCGTKPGPCLIYAGSMGNLGALNAIRNGVIDVVAYHGTIPALDLLDLHDNNRLGSAAGIETAYGGLSAFQAAEPTHSPSRFASSYTRLPMRILYSTDDPVTLPSIVQSFASSVGAELVSVGAQGHADTGASAGDVARWLRSFA